ncbi:hypothetical protein Tcan_13806 [Toxocara canis]|uniref:Uncharacterized protein n=1 Tax=Toxocara canis TaxID=6265 RepID=A0A0B2VQU7_TOXCA|nr:hypothetical protein Tcan_13806 [Toxocara canis]
MVYYFFVDNCPQKFSKIKRPVQSNAALYMQQDRLTISQLPGPLPGIPILSRNRIVGSQRMQQHQKEQIHFGRDKDEFNKRITHTACKQKANFVVKCISSHALFGSAERSSKRSMVYAKSDNNEISHTVYAVREQRIV